MALQIPSGLITQVSGGGLVSGTVGPTVAYPIPFVLVGAGGASASGNHSITDNSGALNVNISGGNLGALLSGLAVSVSGDIVLVVSGGTVQVSGSVNVVSGNIFVTSGAITILGSGQTPFTMLSGNISNFLSGQTNSGAWIQPIVPLTFDYSGTTFTPVGTDISGSNNIRVALWAGRTALGGQNSNIDNINANAQTLITASWTGLLGGNSSWDRARTVTGSSGGSLGVLAVQQVGYTWNLVSGATIVNIKSGSAFLHAIVINSYSSGGQAEVMDSASGVSAGGRLGTISPTINTIANTDLAPTTLVYDALMISGIVISTSGAFWNMTVLWRTATS